MNAPVSLLRARSVTRGTDDNRRLHADGAATLHGGSSSYAMAKCSKNIVELRGFEPLTPWMQTRGSKVYAGHSGWSDG